MLYYARGRRLWDYRAPSRMIFKPRTLSLAGLLATAALLSMPWSSAGAQWQLEADTILTIPNARSSKAGTCQLKKGTRVDLISGADADPLTLSFANVVFEMPRGTSLAKALQELRPNSPVTAESVFDAEAWQKRKLLPPEEAQWLPVSPAPDDRRKDHWDPRGFFAIPENSLPPRTAETAPPAGFAWDRTLVIPGRFAFLNLPFILQKKPGICVGASAINVVRYLCPDNQLTTDEFFRLLTARSHGASNEDLKSGMELLGLPAQEVMLSRSGAATALRQIKRNLDNNLPVLAADGRHMVLITGYDTEKKKLFVWNQWGNGKIVNGMPKGHYELQESDLPIEFRTLFFCRKVRYEPADNVKQALESVTGALEDLQMHPYIETEFSRPVFLVHAGPERLRAVLRAGRTVFVQQGGSVLSVLPSAAGDNDKLSCIELPSGAKHWRTLSGLSQEITTKNGGAFFSAKKEEQPAVAKTP